MATTTGDKQKRRERNALLKNYYGLSPTQPVKTDPMNIDDASFDALKYFAKLVKDQPLNTLIKVDNGLVGEVQEIEGDMKTLVYENYNKFISATDTIRKMKTNVEQMESAMNKLNDKMGQISAHNGRVHSALAGNRHKVQQLDNVHHQLQRLQFIFALPNRLQQCHQDGNDTQAVKYYARARKLLDHYRDMPAFQSIERECAAVMDKIKQDLWHALTKHDTPLAQINEKTKLLVLLKEDPPRLWAAYTDACLASSTPITSPNESNNTIAALINTRIVPLEDVARHFRAFFLSSVSETSETGSVLHLSLDDHDHARKHLLTKLQPRIDAIFDTMNGIIDGKDDRVDQVKDLMTLRDAFDNVPALAATAAVDTRFNEYFASWEAQLVDTLILTTPKAIIDRIDTFHREQPEKDPKFVRRFLEDLSLWLAQHLKAHALLPLKACVQAMSEPCRAPFLTRLQQGWKTMWMDLADALMATKLNASTTLYAMTLARLCYNVADHEVLQCYQDLSMQLYGTMPSYDTPHPTIAPHLIDDANDLMDHFAAVGKHLVNNQIRVDGYGLSTIVQTCYEDDEDEETDEKALTLSPAWTRIMAHFQMLAQWMHAIFPTFAHDHSQQQQQQQQQQQHQEHQHLRTNSSNFGSHFGDDGVDDASDSATAQHLPPPLLPAGLGLVPRMGGPDFSLMHNIDKLFAEHVAIYSAVDPSARGVIDGLARIVLKAFQEAVRLTHAIDTRRYQQLQLDAEFVQRALWTMAASDKWINTMLQDILANAYLRCSQPINLPPEVSLKSVTQRKISKHLSPPCVS
ncbi:Vps51/Vps67-domain-containing protein [Gongronella butleri]|nr:Vps51/Vps67-domain-containing protein [Gongronella butleri]